MTRGRQFTMSGQAARQAEARYARQSNPNAEWEKQLPPMRSWAHVMVLGLLGVIGIVGVMMLLAWGIG